MNKNNEESQQLKALCVYKYISRLIKYLNICLPLIAYLRASKKCLRRVSWLSLTSLCYCHYTLHDYVRSGWLLTRIATNIMFAISFDYARVALASHNCCQFIYCTRADPVNWFISGLGELIWTVFGFFTLSLPHEQGRTNFFTGKFAVAFLFLRVMNRWRSRDNRFKFNLRWRCRQSSYWLGNCHLNFCGNFSTWSLPPGADADVDADASDAANAASSLSSSSLSEPRQLPTFASTPSDGSTELTELSSTNGKRSLQTPSLASRLSALGTRPSEPRSVALRRRRKSSAALS